MTVSINRFPAFDIFQERFLGFVHFRFCGLDLVHVAHKLPPGRWVVILTVVRRCRSLRDLSAIAMFRHPMPLAVVTSMGMVFRVVLAGEEEQ